MEGTRLQIRTEGYPDKLTAALGQEAPAAVAFAGNAALLQQRTLALFCSIHCPGAMIMQTYEFVKHLRLRSVSIISGFHSPMARGRRDGHRRVSFADGAGMPEHPLWRHGGDHRGDWQGAGVVSAAGAA